MSISVSESTSVCDSKCVVNSNESVSVCESASVSDSECIVNSSESVVNSVVNHLYSGRCVFLTGGAGVGKTYTTREIITRMEQDHANVVKCAPTGVAALNLPNGRTLHSTFGLPVADWPSYQIWGSRIVSRIKQVDNPFVHTVKTMHFLVIDEISMCSAWMIEMLDIMFRIILQNNKPMGGIACLFVGDFMQLAPVYVEKSIPKPNKRQEMYAFMSLVWKRMNPLVVYLTEIKRQTETDFTEIINQIRMDDPLNFKQKQLLNSLIALPPKDPCSKSMQIMIHREGVMKINNDFLRKTIKRGNPIMDFVFPSAVSEMDQRLESSALTNAYQTLISALENDIRGILYIGEETKCQTFCKGARVMQIVNSGDYVNGDRGTVVGFVDIPEYLRGSRSKKVNYELGESIWDEDNSEQVYIGETLVDSGTSSRTENTEDEFPPVYSPTDSCFTPVVQFDRTGQILAVLPYRWERSMDVYDKESKFSTKVFVYVDAIPLSLAWASTVHKIQGATLTGPVHIDCSDMHWIPSTFYVALSRSASLYGISLSNYRGFYKCPLAAQRFYENQCNIEIIQSFDLIPSQKTENNPDKSLEDEIIRTVDSAIYSSQSSSANPSEMDPIVVLEQEWESTAVHMLDDLHEKYGTIKVNIKKRKPHLHTLLTTWMKKAKYEGC